MSKRARRNYIHAMSHLVNHKKMYKAKKHWVVAGMSFLALTGLSLLSFGNSNVHADTANKNVKPATVRQLPSSANSSSNVKSSQAKEPNLNKLFKPSAVSASVKSTPVLKNRVNATKAMQNNAGYSSNNADNGATSNNQNVSAKPVKSNLSVPSIKKVGRTNYVKGLNNLFSKSREEVITPHYTEYAGENDSKSYVNPNDDTNSTKTDVNGYNAHGDYIPDTWTWGTADLSFDSNDGTLTVSNGEVDDSISNPWNNGGPDHGYNTISWNQQTGGPEDSGYWDDEEHYDYSTHATYGDNDSYGNPHVYNGTYYLINNEPHHDNNYFDNAADKSDVYRIVFHNVKLGSNVSNLLGAHFLPNLQSIKIDGLTGSNSGTTSNMSELFANQTNLAEIDGLGSLDTTDATNMSGMFENDPNLVTLNLNNFSTDNCHNFSNMFSGDTNLKEVDIANFNTENGSTNGMFDGTSLDKLVIGQSTALSGTGLSHSILWHNSNDATGQNVNDYTRTIDDGTTNHAGTWRPAPNIMIIQYVNGGSPVGHQILLGFPGEAFSSYMLATTPGYYIPNDNYNDFQFTNDYVNINVNSNSSYYSSLEADIANDSTVAQNLAANSYVTSNKGASKEVSYDRSLISSASEYVNNLNNNNDNYKLSSASSAEVAASDATNNASATASYASDVYSLSSFDSSVDSVNSSNASSSAASNATNISSNSSFINTLDSEANALSSSDITLSNSTSSNYVNLSSSASKLWSSVSNNSQWIKNDGSKIKALSKNILTNARNIIAANASINTVNDRVSNNYGKISENSDYINDNKISIMSLNNEYADLGNTVRSDNDRLSNDIKSLDTRIAHNQDMINGDRNEFDNKLANVNDNLNERVDDIKSKLSQDVSDNKREIIDYVNGVKTVLNGKIDSNATKLTDKINRTSERLSYELSNDHEDSLRRINNTADDLRSETNQLVHDTRNELEAKIQDNTNRIKNVNAQDKARARNLKNDINLNQQRIQKLSDKEKRDYHFLNDSKVNKDTFRKAVANLKNALKRSHNYLERAIKVDKQALNDKINSRSDKLSKKMEARTKKLEARINTRVGMKEFRNAQKKRDEQIKDLQTEIYYLHAIAQGLHNLINNDDSKLAQSIRENGMHLDELDVQKADRTELNRDFGLAKSYAVELNDYMNRIDANNGRLFHKYSKELTNGNHNENTRINRIKNDLNSRINHSNRTIGWINHHTEKVTYTRARDYKFQYFTPVRDVWVHSNLNFSYNHDNVITTWKPSEHIIAKIIGVYTIHGKRNHVRYEVKIGHQLGYVTGRSGYTADAYASQHSPYNPKNAHYLTKHQVFGDGYYGNYAVVQVRRPCNVYYHKYLSGKPKRHLHAHYNVLVRRIVRSNGRYRLQLADGGYMTDNSNFLRVL